MTSWFNFVIISSFITYSTIFSAIFDVANVKSNTDRDISECDVYVILSKILINSQLNRLVYEINSFTRIEFWVFEFHHEWCALKSLHIIVFSETSIDVHFRSTVYFWCSSWDFSLWILKIIKFLTFDKIFNIWSFESFEILYFEVQINFAFFETKVIVHVLTFCSVLNTILMNAKCAIEILLFSIYDSCNNTIFALID